jgi:hypothetical protein
MESIHSRKMPRLAVAALTAACLAAACTSAGATNPASAAPSAGASTSGGSGGFYLRAWTTQALALQYTFGTLPMVTIADGKFFDGMIAIPMIYPGPLYVGVSSRTITPKGIDEISAEARNDGLLDGGATFGQFLPGGMTCHLAMTVAGVSYDLVGACPDNATPSAAAPGTAAAFAAFWVKLQSLSTTWLASELGESVPYTPDRLAVLAGPPADASGPISPTQVPWPLATSFDSFGTPAGSADTRCATVSRSDLSALLPVVQNANQLTRFADSKGVLKSLQVRVLVPGEPAPC